MYGIGKMLLKIFFSIQRSKNPNCWRGIALLVKHLIQKGGRQLAGKRAIVWFS